MDSQVPYTATPPSYSSSQPAPYPPQQYPPPSQYPPSQDKQYPPPGTGYPPQPGFGTPQYTTAPPPQPEQVVVVSAPAQQAVVVQHVPSFVGHIIFACIVAWCCNWLFGLIAFILASQYSLFTIILNINIEKYRQRLKNHLSPYHLHQLQCISGVDRSILPTLFNMVQAQGQYWAGRAPPPYKAAPYMAAANFVVITNGEGCALTGTADIDQ